MAGVRRRHISGKVCRQVDAHGISSYEARASLRDPQIYTHIHVDDCNRIYALAHTYKNMDKQMLLMLLSLHRTSLKILETKLLADPFSLAPALYKHIFKSMILPSRALVSNVNLLTAIHHQLLVA